MLLEIDRRLGRRHRRDHLRGPAAAAAPDVRRLPAARAAPDRRRTSRHRGSAGGGAGGLGRASTSSGRQRRSPVAGSRLAGRGWRTTADRATRPSDRARPAHALAAGPRRRRRRRHRSGNRRREWRRAGAPDCRRRQARRRVERPLRRRAARRARAARRREVARWLGDIRSYFPSSVVQVMQTDAMDRLGLRQLLLEPELLEAVQPDIDLVIDADRAGPGRSPSTRGRRPAPSCARSPTSSRNGSRPATVQAVTGALNRAARTRRPKLADVDWNRTIAANLKHYQPEYTHGRARAPRRLRPTNHAGRARDHPVHRPVRLDGRVDRLLVGLRRGARVAAFGRDEARRLRHRGGRPHRRARRPGRRAVRRPARRRHRHQPGAGLLPGLDHHAERHRAGADQRSLRGRHRRGDAPSGARPSSDRARR